MPKVLVEESLLIRLKFTTHWGWDRWEWAIKHPKSYALHWHDKDGIIFVKDPVGYSYWFDRNSGEEGPWDGDDDYYQEWE